MRCSSIVRAVSLITALSATACTRGALPDCVRRSGRTVLACASTRSKYGTLAACMNTVAPSAAAARTPPE
jgi:hypothetical protein